MMLNLLQEQSARESPFRHCRIMLRRRGKKVAVAELVVVLKLYAQCAASEDSLLHPMKTVLKTVLAVVDCTHAGIGELCDAVDLLEELKKQTAATAVGQNKSVLLEFLVGSAGQLFLRLLVLLWQIATLSWATSKNSS